MQVYFQYQQIDFIVIIAGRHSYHGENFYRYIANYNIPTIPKLEYDFWHICVCVCVHLHTHTHTHWLKSLESVKFYERLHFFYQEYSNTYCKILL